MKKRLMTLACLTGLTVAEAQNPIIRDQFTADPTARVFNGKIYMFPSHDIKAPADYPRKDWFCMADYHVFSSDNLIDWTDHGVILSQENVPWGNPKAYSMWAPDCVEKNGKYYFYFPDAGNQERRGFRIGVAVADRPEGPYTPMATPIDKVHGIDPCVLMDDDGKSYIYYAMAGKIYGAQLKDNMTELASDTMVMKGLPEGFKEGPFMFKRKGKYYLTVPWVRKNTETLAYAMGDSPMGPFEYKGLIMEESPTGCWTNHHSLVEYNGSWYLFYHHNDYSPRFDKLRSARIDRVVFREDGTINEVKPTLRGVGITPADTKIQVDRYSKISDGANIAHLDTVNTFLGWKTNFEKVGGSVTYDDVDFGKGTRRVSMRICSPNGAQLLVDAGGRAKKVNVPATKEWKVIETGATLRAKGINRLKLTLLKGNVALDWISFR